MITAERTPLDIEGDAPRPELTSSMEALYRLHSAPLLRFLLRLTRGDRRAAEDLLQETLLRTWRYMQDHPVVVDQLRPWLFTVARRIAIDASRGKRATPMPTTDAPMAMLMCTVDDVERLLASIAMKQALMTLSPHHRRVIVEIFYHGRSPRETAELLDVPLGTVRSRTFYAIRALAAAMVGSPGRD